MSRVFALLALALLCLGGKPCRCPKITDLGLEEGFAMATMAAYEHAICVCRYDSRNPDPKCVGALDVYRALDAELKDRRRHLPEFWEEGT